MTVPQDRARRMHVVMFVTATIPIIVVLSTLLSASWYLVTYGSFISDICVGGIMISWGSFEVLKHRLEHHQ